MLNNWENFQFSTMKKLWDLAQENLVDFQIYFYFSTELHNLVNTLYLWISLGLAEASHWTVSVLIKFLLPELMSNVHSKLYKKLFTCICIYNFCTLWLWATYISHFIESPILFGLYTYRYIPQQQKNKIPKGGEKDLPGWCQWTQTG